MRNFKKITTELSYRSVVNFDDVDKDVRRLFSHQEKIYTVCKANKDLLVLTDKRISIVDLYHTSNKRTIYSIPYSSISTYSVDINYGEMAIELITNNTFQLVIKFTEPMSLDTMYNIYGFINEQIK